MKVIKLSSESHLLIRERATGMKYFVSLFIKSRERMNKAGRVYVPRVAFLTVLKVNE